MSATVLDPPAVEEAVTVKVKVKKESAFKRARRRMAAWLRKLWGGTVRVTRRIARATVSGGKAAGRWVWNSAKVLGRYSVKGVKYVGIGVVRGIGWLGYGITWAIKTVLNLAIALVTSTAFLIVTGVVLLVTGIILLASWVSEKWSIYIVGSFQYLTKRQQLTYREFIGARRETVWDTAARRTEYMVDKMGEAVGVATDSTVPGVVVEEEIILEEGEYEEEDRPSDYVDPKFEAEEMAKLEARAEEQLQRDFDHQEEEFPGATTMVTEDVYDGHFDARTEPDRVFTEQMEKVDGDVFKLDFSEVVNDVDLEDTFEALQLNAANKQIAAYWLGRLEMLRQWKLHPEWLEHGHGRAWAKINSKYRTRQAEFPLKFVRVGAVDMVRDLQKAHAKV